MNEKVSRDYMMHESSYLDHGAKVGDGTKIWHFCHICSGAVIGKNCVLGQNVYIGPGVKIGDGCKIQNNVSIYEGVELEDHVFLGPSCVFTNIKGPRACLRKAKDEYVRTFVGKGASIGANATIVCGVTLSAWCFVGAGAVVTKDVVPHALVMGVPARQVGVINADADEVRWLDEDTGDDR